MCCSVCYVFKTSELTTVTKQKDIPLKGSEPIQTGGVTPKLQNKDQPSFR